MARIPLLLFGIAAMLGSETRARGEEKVRAWWKETRLMHPLDRFAGHRGPQIHHDQRVETIGKLRHIRDSHGNWLHQAEAERRDARAAHHALTESTGFEERQEIDRRIQRADSQWHDAAHTARAEITGQSGALSLARHAVGMGTTEVVVRALLELLPFLVEGGPQILHQGVSDIWSTNNGHGLRVILDGRGTGGPLRRPSEMDQLVFGLTGGTSLHTLVARVEGFLGSLAINRILSEASWWHEWRVEPAEHDDLMMLLARAAPDIQRDNLLILSNLDTAGLGQ